MDRRTDVSCNAIPDIDKGLSQPDRWDEAYRRVDAYLAALGVGRAILRRRLAREAVRGARQSLQPEHAQAPVEMAMDELREEIVAWMRHFVRLPPCDREEAFLQTRLALLLADMPQQWHTLFLVDPPLPDTFVAALRERLESVPRFRPGRMEVHSLDLGLVPHLAEAALHTLERTPLLRLMVVWGFFVSFFGLLFYFTR